jgi:putative serine protease PepD
VKTPKHLWSGDWRAESEALRQERPAGPPPAEPATAAEDAPVVTARVRRGPPRAAMLGAGVTGLVAVIVAAFLLGGGGSSNTSSTSSRATAALPAAPGQALKPSAGESRAGAIYKAASPGVVSIRISGASGTGFLVDKPGTIVTNAHVVDTSTRVTVRFGARGRNISGTVLGTDPSSDLAVVHIDPSAVPKGASPLKLGDSSALTVGDPVIAIGNPFGLDRTETAGIVSALGREIQAPNGFQISEAIQTDAAINPGNSGGPLLDETGRVIGVNSQIETSGGSNGNVGVGFAVPVNTLRRVVPVLEQGKSIEHPWLGVSSQDAGGDTGAQIASVVPGSPADSAGLHPGDVITGIDADSVKTTSDLGSLVDSHSVGDHVTLHIRRGGRTVDLSTTLRLRPAQVP